MINNNGKWKFYSAILGVDDFYIEGINIWDEEWIYTEENAIVLDPTYKKEYKTFVIKIIKDDIKIEFVAVEFSNEIWGIYLRNDYHIRHVMK